MFTSKNFQNVLLTEKFKLCKIQNIKNWLLMNHGFQKELQNLEINPTLF